MSHAAEAAPPPPTLWHGVQITLLVVAVVVGWIFLGSKVGLSSFYASFLLLWYWATVEKVAFNRLPASVIGALVGVGLGSLPVLMPSLLGPTNGLIVAYVAILAALFVVVMNWLPIAINGSTMLFLTVLGAPILLKSVNFVEFAEAIVLGALFFAAVMYLVTLYVRMRTKAPAPS